MGLHAELDALHREHLAALDGFRAPWRALALAPSGPFYLSLDRRATWPENASRLAAAAAESARLSAERLCKRATAIGYEADQRNRAMIYRRALADGVTLEIGDPPADMFEHVTASGLTAAEAARSRSIELWAALLRGLRGPTMEEAGGFGAGIPLARRTIAAAWDRHAQRIVATAETFYLNAVAISSSEFAHAFAEIEVAS